MSCSRRCRQGSPGENIEDSVIPRYLVRQHLRAEDHRQRFVAQELGIALRACYEAAAARHCLGQAGGPEMHAIAKTACRNKAGAAGAVRAERMRLIDDQRAAAPLGNRDEVLQSGKVAVNAVERMVSPDFAGLNLLFCVCLIGICLKAGESAFF